MRILNEIETRLEEDLTDLLVHMRNNYAWERMAVEDYEQVMAVYMSIHDLATSLLAGTLEY